MTGDRRAVPRAEDFRFRCSVDVRFRDLDAMGHVNNAVYFTYFEVARAAYMRALGHVDAGSSMHDLGRLFPFILAEASCRYLEPVRLGEALTVFLRTSEVGRKSFELEYLLTKGPDDRPVAVGLSTQVYYDYSMKRTSEIPVRFLRALEAMEGRALGGG